jgi:hypothetical protein
MFRFSLSQMLAQVTTAILLIMLHSFPSFAQIIVEPDGDAGVLEIQLPETDYQGELIDDYSLELRSVEGYPLVDLEFDKTYSVHDKTYCLRLQFRKINHEDLCGLRVIAGKKTTIKLSLVFYQYESEHLIVDLGDHAFLYVTRKEDSINRIRELRPKDLDDARSRRILHFPGKHLVRAVAPDSNALNEWQETLSLKGGQVITAKIQVPDQRSILQFSSSRRILPRLEKKESLDGDLVTFCENHSSARLRQRLKRPIPDGHRECLKISSGDESVSYFKTHHKNRFYHLWVNSAQLEVRPQFGETQNIELETLNVRNINGVEPGVYRVYLKNPETGKYQELSYWKGSVGKRWLRPTNTSMWLLNGFEWLVNVYKYDSQGELQKEHSEEIDLR